MGGPASFYGKRNEQSAPLRRPNARPYVKDGITIRWLVHGQQDAVNPAQSGTKAAAHHQFNIDAGQTVILRLRLSPADPGKARNPFANFDQTFEARRREADEFYRSITPPSIGEDAASVMRQALAGMLWTKQYYFFDADRWLGEHGIDPLEPTTRHARNREWFHMINDHIISMPDKWEYPWYAAWDLAFHTIALSTVDVDFAKEQLDLMLQPTYLHPSGQIPAYEWNFSDVNPPVHAWASVFLYRTEQALRGEGDADFLKRVFGKLALNFNWWVNRKDRFGKNVFEGGFLGLDNIGVFDRSAPLPTGGNLEQADGTAWMALFCQNMAEIAVELTVRDPSFEDMALKFFDHLLWIGTCDESQGCRTACGMRKTGSITTCCVCPMGAPRGSRCAPWWDCCPLRDFGRRSVAAEAGTEIEELTSVQRMRRMPELFKSMHPTGPGHFGVAERGIIALVNPEQATPDPGPHARRERIPESVRNSLIVSLPCRSSIRNQRRWQ